MTAPVERAGLRVAPVLAQFIEDRALPGTGIDRDAFWQGFAAILTRFTPENRSLLATRDALQARIDEWHGERADGTPDPAAYRAFLEEIGYLVGEPAPFTITTDRVDDEVARILNQVVEGQERPRSIITFQTGEQVNVTDGPFEGFSGMVEEVDQSNSRLKVSVSIFGRATPVELEFAQVAKAS